MLMLGALTAGLLSGGAKLIGGLLSGNAANKQAADLNRQNNAVNRVNHAQTDALNAANVAWRERAMAAARTAARHPVNVKQMMQDADKAGFNPVTWLNAGAMQMYGRKTDVALSNLDNPANNLWQRNGPVSASLGSGAAIGDALGAGVDTFLSQQQQIDQNSFQNDQLMKTLAAAQTRTQSRFTGWGSTPGYRSTGRSQSGGAYMAASGGRAPSIVGVPAVVAGANQAGNPSGTDLNVSGVKWHFPGPDGQTIEDVLGENEVISTIYGVGRMAASLWHPENMKLVKDAVVEGVRNLPPPSGFKTWGDWQSSWGNTGTSSRAHPGPVRVNRGGGAL